MKKILVLFFILSAFTITVLSQNNCGTAQVIENLPYYQSGLTTSGTGNDYSPEDACSSDAMACEDYVFAFTPETDMTIRVNLLNTSITSEIPFGVTANIGLFITEGCPDETGSVCIASEDGLQENPGLDMISVTGGVTYYIIVSSEFYVLFIQQFATTVSFDIAVEQIYSVDAATIGIDPLLSGCDLNSATITAQFKNTGLEDFSGIELSFQVGNLSPITENYNNTVEAGEEFEYTFAAEADISELGTHTIKVFCHLPGDEFSDNDYQITSVTNTPLIATFPHNEDFESNEGFFYTEGTNSSWAYGAPDDSNPELVINTAASGDYMWCTNLSGNANTGEVSYLISPCFDVHTLLTPTVKFKLWIEPGILPGYGGTGTLEASVDGGNTYNITVATWNTSTGGWAENEFEIEELIGEENVRFRFSYTSGFLASEGMAIDDFMVKDEVLVDVSPGTLTLPVGACGLSDQEFVKLYINNNGALPQSDIPITYSLDGGLSWLNVTETVPGPIPPHDSVGFTFGALADLSEPGSYLLVIRTMLVGDEDMNNDTITYEIINTMVVSVIPYAESFETEDHGWIGSAGSSWARGIPGDTLTINHAYDGQYVIATNPLGNTNFNEISELVSPCFDFTSLTGVRLSMKIWYETGFMPATIDLQGSVDGGSEWFEIETGWTGSSGGWITKSYYIPEFAGLSDCKVRIVYTGQLLPSEGIAIDDVHFDPVFEKDLGVSNFLSPGNSCALGASEHLTIEIVNYGTASQSNFPVQYSMNGGGTWITQNFIGSLAPQQTAQFVFSQSTVDLSQENTYTVLFRTQISGDMNSGNDDFATTIVHTQSIGSFPYDEVFETSDGGWVAYGTASSFELGTPAGTIINAAGEGNYSWVTNLDGNHNSGELSYLQGPCFDFSELTNPMLKAAVIYETSMFMAGFYVEYSTDNGITWDTLPDGGSTGSWYGSSLIPGFGSTWSGSSGGWVQVSTNMPLLAGLDNVNLRFVFNSGSFSFMQTEGVGIDDIHVYDCTNLPESSFDYELNGLTVQFTSDVSDADSILWNFGDNEFLPSTSTEPNPSFTYTQEGYYLVTLTAVNECGSTVVESYIDVTTSLFLANENKIRVFPNPTHGTIGIEAPEYIKSVTVSNIQGSVLYSFQGNGKNISFDLNGLSAGMYILRINTDSECYVRPFIAE
ncbi:MAG TPA: T9SS type A sorting domain-containing protein [Bacteroidales bacterium]|nr:T9SS type A sorting domain-containing protein [Bacteroidales bacterium]HQP03237.1 T9SS type A sorting domain-containing protein [Bacteroidales bacterium]